MPYRTLTPYLIATDADGLIGFVTRTFGGEEKFRAIGSAGGIHCEVLVGDAMLMIGGGGPGLSWRGEAKPMVLRVYVADAEGVCRSAVEGGASEVGALVVQDPFGTRWQIAQGAASVRPCLPAEVVRFVEAAFGAEASGGLIAIGDSVIELVDEGLPSTLYLSVPDVDAVYGKALAAGARSTMEPAERPGIGRMAGVVDAFGNDWYLAGSGAS